MAGRHCPRSVRARAAVTDALEHGHGLCEVRMLRLSDPAGFRPTGLQLEVDEQRAVRGGGTGSDFHSLGRSLRSVPRVRGMRMPADAELLWGSRRAT